jgi:Helix-turn-helix domain
MKNKNSAQARGANSRESSQAVTLPINGGIEQPVTTEQLAAHLQVTTRTIASYRAKRIIPFWRLNARRILYRISDVERCLSLMNR